MKTDALISLLATSAHETRDKTSPWLQLTLLLAASAVTLTITLVLYKLNPNLLEIAGSAWFWLRFVFLASLGFVAWICVKQLGNPARAFKTKLWLLALPSALMALVAASLVWAAEPGARVDMLLGTTWRVCSLAIAFLAIPLFASSVLIVRRLAPTRLKVTGGALGLFSGALAALIYTLHCPELHPAFLVVWYGIGILIPAVLGWLLGERLLRW
jgi:hypothetical protein